MLPLWFLEPLTKQYSIISKIVFNRNSYILIELGESVFLPRPKTFKVPHTQYFLKFLLELLKFKNNFAFCRLKLTHSDCISSQVPFELHLTGAQFVQRNASSTYHLRKIPSHTDPAWGKVCKDDYIKRAISQPSAKSTTFERHQPRNS